MIHSIEHGGHRVKLSTRGATLLSWDPGCGYSVLGGYQDDAELAEYDGYRNAVLAPWCNRIKDAVWDDAGTARSVLETSGAEGLHGLVTGENFDLETSATGAVLRKEMAASEAFPTSFGLAVTFDLSGPKVLAMTMEVTNTGNVPAPFGLGFHPYFAIKDLASARVEVPADHRIVVDEALIPAPGNEPFIPYEPAPFKNDDDFAVTGLSATDGWSEAKLATGLAADVVVAMKTDNHPFANFHLYSGGMLKRNTNREFALEPCTMWADIYNRPELKEKILLVPGHTLTHNIKLTALF